MKNPKLKFIGVGNAFANDTNYQSNAAIEFENNKIFLIDCGTDLRHSIKDIYPEIHNGNLHEHIIGTYISHIHADHCGGLEWLGFCTYFNPDAPKIPLIAAPNLPKELWETTLRGGMEITDSLNSLDDYFEVIEEDKFNLNQPKENSEGKEYDLSVKLIESIHVENKEKPKKSYGLFITNQKIKTYFSSDVVFSNYKKNQDYYWEANQIFHDCETTPYKSGVHPHYDDLKTLPSEIKSKMYLYHYTDDANKKFKPEEDGFKGFVQRGKEYSL